MDERTLRMKKEFLDLWKQGLTVEQIAEKHGISKGTVYKHLQEIADENGVTREELLRRPFKADHSARCYKPVERIDFEEASKLLSSTKTEIDSLIAEMSKLLEELKGECGDIDEGQV